MPTRLPRAVPSSTASPDSDGFLFGTGSAPSAPTDLNALMQAHLTRMFNQRDRQLCLDALEQLYANDATLFEPHAETRRRKAICDAVDVQQASLPPDFTFSPLVVAVGHYELARLRWRASSPGGPSVVMKSDVARIENGHTKAL